MVRVYYRPSKTGAGKKVKDSQIRACLRDKQGLLWLDLEDPSPHEVAILSEVFRFHPLAIEDCLSPELQHPKIDDYEDYLFLIFHAVLPDFPLDITDTVELNIFVGRNFLVTYHRTAVQSLSRVWERKERDERVMSRGSHFLLYTLLDTLVDDYLPILDQMDDIIDGIEHEVFRNPTQETLSRIFSAKRDTLYLRRVLAPQREVLLRLSRGEFALIKEPAYIYFRDVYDHMVRVIDANDALRDLVNGALDTYLSVFSNRLNEVMKTLTIVATVILPLSLIAGIYGMNFQFMPELTWRYGYFVVLGIMLIVAGGMFIYFRRRGWL
ncbi:MAG: magnesium/cobalt transporter CorA [Chloroflexi bacterium]|nr:magnesium/cobalt transporter CorA [Chloroflexota bacterium]